MKTKIALVGATIATLLAVTETQAQPYTVKLRVDSVQTHCYPSCDHPYEWRTFIHADIFDADKNLIPPSSSYYYDWGMSQSPPDPPVSGWTFGYGMSTTSADGNLVKNEGLTYWCQSCPYDNYLIRCTVIIDGDPWVSPIVRLPDQGLGYIPVSQVVTVDQKRTSQASVGNVGRKIDNGIYSYAAPFQFFLNTNATEIFKASQNLFSNPLEKYHNWWYVADVVNHSPFPITSPPPPIVSQLELSEDATIGAQLMEVGDLGGSIDFFDPWYPDDFSDPLGPRNRGSAAIPHTVSYSQHNIGTGSIYKGVFLNQSGPPPWIPPYYSVFAPSAQTIGSFSGRFQWWTGTNATFQYINAQQTGVVFTNSGATATASYKGIHLSNNSTTWSNSSQRKFTQTPDGWQHVVYESGGHIYYENKSPGGNWQIVSRGANLYQDDESSQSPCVEYHSVATFGTMVIVAFQTANNIVLRTFMFQNGQYYDWGTPIPIYTGEALVDQINPNVAFFHTGEFMVIWEGKSAPGIHYWFGMLNGDWTNIQNIASGVITGTDANSIYAAISTDKLYPYSTYFDIAWEQYVSPTSSSIKYRNLAYTGTMTQWPDTGALNISYGSSYFGSNVTIISLPDGPRIGWWSKRHSQPFAFTTLCRPLYSQYWLYDPVYVTRSNSLAKLDDNSMFYFAWSRGTTPGVVNRLVSSNNLSQVKFLNTAGEDVQLCNGATTSTMYATAYYRSTSPYYFQTSNSLGSFGKIASGSMIAGRGLSLSKDGAGFDYSLGRLTVDGNSVNFVRAADSVRYNTLDVINRVLISEPFTLRDGSEITFDEYSRFGDSSAAVGVLGERGYLSFKVELVDDASGEVIGMIKKSRFTSSELQSRDMTVYRTSVAGLRVKVAKVKITAETNIDRPRVALAENYIEPSGIGKLNVEELTLQRSDMVREYSLEQNYPNPWNPSTAIRYALPQKSHVFLAVYTTLGQLVKQLVNEEQEGGYHDVVFRADGLASGVYFYRLQAGNYVSTKKLLLLK